MGKKITIKFLIFWKQNPKLDYWSFVVTILDGFLFLDIEFFTRFSNIWQQIHQRDFGLLNRRIADFILAHWEAESLMGCTILEGRTPDGNIDYCKKRSWIRFLEIYIIFTINFKTKIYLATINYKLNIYKQIYTYDSIIWIQKQ